MRAICLLLASVAVISATTLRLETPQSALDGEWKSYKLTFNKSYPSQIHESVRRLQWEKNLRYIQKHNVEADLGKHTFFLGLNEYADMSNEEFRQLMACRMINLNSEGGSTFLTPENIQLPTTVDWRTKGYVTGVKNQGACGSCWTFSTTGSLEGQHFKKTGKLVSLSEQQIVDCSEPFGTGGCNGGWMDNAFRYIKANKGIDSEASYPYTARNGTCHFRKADVAATVTGFVDVQSGSEAALQKAVATVGPISVAIDASHPSFQMYSHGVYSEPKCGTHVQDHAVLVVGYGTDTGKDYWLVKNSWGPSWGMKGYIMMSRNKDNQCGIASNASYPLV